MSWCAVVMLGDGISCLSEADASVVTSLLAIEQQYCVRDDYSRSKNALGMD